MKKLPISLELKLRLGETASLVLSKGNICRPATQSSIINKLNLICLISMKTELQKRLQGVMCWIISW